MPDAGYQIFPHDPVGNKLEFNFRITKRRKRRRRVPLRRCSFLISRLRISSKVTGIMRSIRFCKGKP